MKWLSAGLTFVNLSTVCGLLLGMVGNGLNELSAVFSLVAGAAFAVAAFLGTSDTARPQPVGVAGELGVSPVARYREFWFWPVAACFVLFALRSFCWLLYIDGDELKIQSPNNLGDLGLHISLIRNFASGVALWPDNPIYVFSKLRYPAGIDLFNGLLCLVHVDLTRGLIWTGLLASLATFYAFFRWTGPFGVAGFLFNGGLAGFQFFKTLKFLDYQGGKTIAWKSIALSMFLTQRGLLYAIPAGLLLLWHWRENLSRVGAQDRRPGPLPFWVELSLYASMPLFHIHTFLALSVVLIFLFAFGDFTIRKHVAALVAGALLPASLFVWLITDHFHAGSVLGWHFGWVQQDEDFARPFFQFWFVNFGVLMPLVLALLAVVGRQLWKSDMRWREKLRTNYVPFLCAAAAIFIFAFTVKLAPWGWDNIKIIIWAYFLVLPFLWTQLIVHWSVPARIGVCIALFCSGFISLFGGLAAGRPGFGFIDRASLDAVGVAVRVLPVESRFAAYPTYNHPLLLQGRKVVLGYPGHLWTEGFDYTKTYDWFTTLMQGTGNWREIARALRVRYMFWGQDETTNYPSSKRPWEATAPLVASGQWGAIYDLEPNLSSH